MVIEMEIFLDKMVFWREYFSALVYSLGELTF